MNQIHPTAIIDTSVQLGANNVIGPYTVITGSVAIGDNNWIGPHVVIGTPAQVRGDKHLNPWNENYGYVVVSIGSGNVIREFSTIQSGTDSVTTLGDDCYLMTQCHVPHDALIADRVTFSNSVQLGGHSIIQTGVNVGLGTVIHQRSLIGAGAMIGMGSVVIRPVLPFSMAFGSPARVNGANRVGMQRTGFAQSIINDVDSALRSQDLEKLHDLLPKEMNDFKSAQKLLT
jgi:UDP-N-acetylglucosamine acyltransferase